MSILSGLRARLLKRLPRIDEETQFLLRWMWDAYIRSQSRWMIAAIIAMLIFAAVQSISVFVFRDLLDVVLQPNAATLTILGLAVLIGVLQIVRGLSNFVAVGALGRASAEIVIRMRRDLVPHILDLDQAFHDRAQLGSLLLRANGLPGQLGGAFTGPFLSLGRDAFTFLGLLIAAFILHWQWMLAVMICAPLIAAVARWSANKSRRLQAEQNELEKEHQSFLQESFAAIRTIKIDQQEARVGTWLDESLGRLRIRQLGLVRVQAIISPAVAILGGGVMAFLTYLGGVQVASGEVSPATLIAFLGAVGGLQIPLRRVLNVNADLQRALVTARDVRSLFDEERKVISLPGATQQLDSSQSFELRDVDFRYDEEGPWLFEGINLRIEGGKHTAIVGPTGSGKTSILALLSRLYDVQGGAVYLGEANLRDLDLGALRASMAIVSQDIILFDDSLSANVRFSRPDASDAEVAAVLKAAQLTELEAKLGKAKLGNRGGRLSGGQKQRVAIARALLKDTPILLLDEATSALDQNTEMQVSSALEAAGKSRTLVSIAHRLSLVKGADTIHVLDQGKVIESGSHEVLMAQGGIYAGMYNAQKRQFG